MVREQLAREARRRRAIWTSIVAITVLVIAGLIGWGIYAAQRPAAKVATPAGASSDGSGIVVGGGPVVVDVYEDFICPACGQFEKVSGPTLDQLVANGKVKIIYHPVVFLDRFSTTQYSTRSSAASGCAADGGKFREYARGLFAKQPPEGSAGLSDDELIQIGGSVGLIDPTFAKCVRDGKFRPWTTHVTDAASARGVNATPTVLVAGKAVEQPTPENIIAAVDAAHK
jgi:protein-disulfide isomerase